MDKFYLITFFYLEYLSSIFKNILVLKKQKLGQWKYIIKKVSLEKAASTFASLFLLV